MRPYADYDPFAWLYSTRWGSEYHEQAWTVLDKLLLHNLRTGAAILDLCCGDGRLTAVLASKGFSMTGVDGSAKMLGYARARAPEIPFIEADARDFEAECPFDAVISTFDALNHVVSPDDFALVCRRAAAALKPGGYFVFDLNREEAYTELWPQTYAEIEPEMVSVTTGSYDRDVRLARCAVTLFRLAGGLWERSDFSLTQYCHREEDVLNSLFAAGFAEAKAFDAAMDLGMYGNIGLGRTYFLARRGIRGAESEGDSQPAGPLS